MSKMDYWFKNSVSKTVNQALSDNGIGYRYNSALSFDQNLAALKKTGIAHETGKNLLFNFLSTAFSQKYGHYDYAMDLRDLYPDWMKPINIIIKNLRLSCNTIVDVGGNCGKELTDIFNENIASKNITLVDIGDIQVEKARKSFPTFGFQVARMEETGLPDNKYDLYLNLRAIQSSGVNQEDTIKESHRLLKEGGLCIVSVANGYIELDKAGNKKPVIGLIEKGELYSDLAQQKAEDIKKLMKSSGFNNCIVIKGSTEIFSYGIK